ncbi:MAG: hypothetical protein Kow0047_01310 [Anaerolineae bacterium]
MRDVRANAEWQGELGGRRLPAEETLRLLVQNVQDVIYRYRLRPSRGFDFISPSVEHLLGCPPEACYADPDILLSRVHPDDRRVLLSLFDGELAEDMALVMRFYASDGSLVWTEQRISYVREHEGVVAVDGVIRNITRRKEMEIALQGALQALQDRNSDLLFLNRLGHALSATLDSQQVVERMLMEVTGKIGAEGGSVWLWDDSQPGWLVCRSAYNQGQLRTPVNLRLGPGQGVAGWVAFHGRSTVVHSTAEDPRFTSAIDGQTGVRTRSLLAVPLRLRDRVIGVLELINKTHGEFDAHDQELVETLAASAAIAIDNARLVESLHRQTEELKARNEELDAFAHTVAHDLQNPLALVVGFADALCKSFREMPEEEVEHHLSTILQSAQKMSRIITELLLLAEVREAGIVLERLDMESIVADALLRLRPEIEKTQAEVMLPARWPTALGHPQWVEEVWFNYLSNGLKYGGRPPRLVLGAKPLPDGYICFWVEDNGAGVPPEERDRIFETFSRLESRGIAGHGLGLSIVRRIMHRLGGQAYVEDGEQGGSRFCFVLPGAE